MNHLEFAELESMALAPTRWEHWAREIEDIFGHSNDGDEEENGYCLDLAHEAWQRGMTASEYVAECQAKPNYCVRLYANGLGFPPGEELRAGPRCHVVIDATTGRIVLGAATSAEFDRWYDHHSNWCIPRCIEEVKPELRELYKNSGGTVHFLIND